MKKILFILTTQLLVVANIHAQTQKSDFRNAIAIGPPFPGVVAVEYEHFFNDYFTSKQLWSVGSILGYGYDAGNLQPKFAKGVQDLFETPVSFEVKRDIAINPFVRYYFGNPEKKWRQSLMFSPSFVFINIENEKTYLFPAYEFHFLGARSLGKRFYFNISMGFKHFVRKSTIAYNGEETQFPAFKFQSESLDEKPKTWLPTTHLYVGYRF